MSRKESREEKKAVRSLAKEIDGMRDLFKSTDGHGIIVALLTRYSGDTLGASKAALVYGVGTGLGLAAGKAMAREHGAKF